MRRRIGYLLRRFVDRIDHEGAPRHLSSYSFTFERGEGIRWREDGKGCRLAYLHPEDYARAHSESDTFGRILNGEEEV